MILAPKNQIDSMLIKENGGTANASTPDSQVKVKKSYGPRRSYDTAYKLRILAAYDNCDNATERGALLRKEGLYRARICTWRKQFEQAKLNGKKSALKTKRSDHLTQENEHLKKKLAHAEAIIDLQKKISDLLGMHILPVEINESKS
jgi:transposase